MSDADEGEPTQTLSLGVGAQANALELLERRWILTVTEGPDRGKTLEREIGVAIAGSHPRADLQLSNDPTISRRHAELTFLPEGVLVVDLDSKNGTRVGGRRSERALARNGDQVHFGSTALRLTAEDGRVGLGAGRVTRFGEFTTASANLQQILAQLEKVAATNSTVLIEGETGTGKDVLARAIHAGSKRALRPFEVVDFGAVTPTLLESALFGHLQGAFTGAIANQAGAFEVADGGTLFLDELGELPLLLQPKLLRAIESRRYRPLGAEGDRPADLRLVCATNRNLAEEVKQGRFRRDLYFRLAVVTVTIPPLRERPEDVPLLAQQMSSDARLSSEVLEALSAYDWPGNVRELRNVIQRAQAFAGSNAIRPADLLIEREEGGSDRALPFHRAKDEVIAAFERRYLGQLLARHRGNISNAAKEAGISRNALYALMKRIGVES